jgi:protein-disulfide isomerase
MTTAAPSRKQAREAAREERRRHEEQARLTAARKRRLMWLAGAFAAAIAIVAVVIAVASSGGGGGSAKIADAGATAKGAAAVAAEFRGIPQSGNTLGNPGAQATLVVFADMQCPFCASFENNVMPSLVQHYVRDGTLRIVFQPLTFLGNDSITGGRMVTAAGLQGRGFQFASLWYRNQGQENTGYATRAYLRGLAKATPGLDAAKAFRDMTSERVGSVLARARSAADGAHVNATPSFLIGKTGSALTKFEAPSLTPEAFYGALDALTS